MRNAKILFEAPGRAVFRTEDVELHPRGGEALVETEYSFISTGTELACLEGIEPWFKLPNVPGYCAVSRVIEAGEDCPFAVGDRVFHFGGHQRYQITSANPFNLLIKAPDDIDPRLVPVVRMAAIAFTGVRAAQIELGDVVLVSGLGMVGALAAQLAKLQGATVLGVEPTPLRRELANRAGIEHVVAPQDAPKALAELSEGKGASTVIEATGITACAETYIKLAAYQGELILLGTPRRECNTSLTEFLRYSHMNEQGLITIKGAHEWLLPLHETPHVKHSIERDVAICFDLVRKGRLRLNELITHELPAEQAVNLYAALREDRNVGLGVLIDWRNT